MIKFFSNHPGQVESVEVVMDQGADIRGAGKLFAEMDGGIPFSMRIGTPSIPECSTQDIPNGTGGTPVDTLS